MKKVLTVVGMLLVVLATLVALRPVQHPESESVYPKVVPYSANPQRGQCCGHEAK